MLHISFVKHEAKREIHINTEGGLVFVSNFCSRCLAPVKFYKVTPDVREKTHANLRAKCFFTSVDFQQM